MPRVSGSALREKILEEAIGIVYREGADHITMRGLGDKLGYSPATIYLYFRNKEELLSEIASHGFEKMAQRSIPAMQHEDPREALRRSARAYIDFALEYPTLFRLMFDVLPPAREDPERHQVAQQMFDLRNEIFSRGRAQGIFRDIPGYLEGTHYWCTLHGFAQLALTRRMPPPDATVGMLELRDQLVDELLVSLSVA